MSFQLRALAADAVYGPQQCSVNGWGTNECVSECPSARAYEFIEELRGLKSFVFYQAL